VVCFPTVGIQYLQRWPVPPVELCACPRGNSTGGCLLIIFPPPPKIPLDYDREYSYLPCSPKSHVPVGVRRPSIW
jgi:hypothetical protein